MKKQDNTKISRGPPKDEILRRARQGLLDRNPLLASPHLVECKACGYSRKIAYLSYLKSGSFEVGETQTIEVPYAAPTIGGLGHAIEKITPILLTVSCTRCGAEIVCSPVSVEYLLFATTKPQQLRNTYV